MSTSGLDLILRAIDLALDRHKVTLAFAGVITISLDVGLFALLANTIAGKEIIVAVAILPVGLLCAWVLGALFSGAIARLAWADLNGQPQLSAGMAMQYALGHLVSFLLAPLGLVLTGLVILLAETLILLLGRVPYAGEVLTGLLYLPLVVFNVLVVLTVYVGGWLVYPVVAEADRGVIGTIRHSVNTVRSATGQIVSYFVLAMLVMVLTIVVLALLTGAGLALTNALMTIGVSPDKMMEIQSSAILNTLTRLLGLPGGLGLGFGLGRSLPVTYRIAGALVSLANLILVGGILVAFPWTFTMTVSCAVYYAVRGAVPAARPVPTPVQPAPVPAAPPTWPQPPAPAAPPQPPYAPPPAPAVGPRCPSCGSETRPGARFCRQCGTRLG